MENDGHDEEVQQEALRGVRAVKVEKDKCEEQSEELETGVTERGTQELQAGDRRQENITAGGGKRQRVQIQQLLHHTHIHWWCCVFEAVCVHSTHWIPSFLRWLRAKPSLVSALSTMAGYTTYFSKHRSPTYSRSNHISTASSDAQTGVKRKIIKGRSEPELAFQHRWVTFSIGACMFLLFINGTHTDASQWYSSHSSQFQRFLWDLGIWILVKGDSISSAGGAMAINLNKHRVMNRILYNTTRLSPCCVEL